MHGTFKRLQSGTTPPPMARRRLIQYMDEKLSNISDTSAQASPWKVISIGLGMAGLIAGVTMATQDPLQHFPLPKLVAFYGFAVFSLVATLGMTRLCIRWGTR